MGCCQCSLNIECFEGGKWVGWRYFRFIGSLLVVICLLLRSFLWQEYFEDTYKQEDVGRMKAMEYGLYWMLITECIISFILCLFFCFIRIKSEIQKKLDGGAHLLVGLCLLIAAVFFAFSIYKNKLFTDNRTDLRGTPIRIILASLAFLSAILYIIFGVLTLLETKKNNAESMPNGQESHSLQGSQNSEG